MPEKRYRVRCRAYDRMGRGLVNFNHSVIPVAGLLDNEMAYIYLKHTKQGTIGILDEVETPSPERILPPCPYYERCGGCQLMHMSYKEQLRFKTNTVKALLEKFCPVEDAIGMADLRHYRNKVHASFSLNKKGKIIAGVYEEGSHRVVDIRECMIQNRTANLVIATIKSLMEKQGIKPYNEDRHTGVMRHVLIRTGWKTGQVMVVLVIGQSRFAGKQNFVKALLKAHPEITSIVLNYNDKKTSMVLGEREEVVFGPGYIEDELCGIRFTLSPSAFYQINSPQTELLYKIAIDMAGLQKTDSVLDAYCGIGTISLIAALKAGQVTGVEINKEAVKNAKNNAKLNHIKNAAFICEDAGKFMVAEAKQKHAYDTVILDPPRSGCDKPFLTSLVKLSPKKIVYISCNPVTQAENIAYLVNHGYKVRKIQPVDMFGGSYHIESLCVLSKN